MAVWSWIMKQVHSIKKVVLSLQIAKPETRLKMITNRRKMDMDLKLAKNGSITKVLDDFRVSSIGKSIKAIIAEYNHTVSRQAPFHSAYEGWALIKHKVDDLWDVIKKEGAAGAKEEMLKEAARIGAMAMRFFIDLGVEDKSAKVSPISDGKKSSFENFI